MVMSFASPLGVGLESEGEYMDIEISSPVSTEEALETQSSAAWMESGWWTFGKSRRRKQAMLWLWCRRQIIW